MRNAAAALAEAGAGLADAVRVRYMLPDRALFARTWPVLRRWLADARPACTMVQAGLMEEAMLFEVEVTAHRPGLGLGRGDVGASAGAGASAGSGAGAGTGTSF